MYTVYSNISFTWLGFMQESYGLGGGLLVQVLQWVVGCFWLMSLYSPLCVILVCLPTRLYVTSFFLHVELSKVNWRYKSVAIDDSIMLHVFSQEYNSGDR